MSEKLRIGVFGGARGRTMMNVLYNHPDAVLVAVCDKYEPLLESAKKTAEEKGLNIALFNNFDDFIEYDMDAVVLANYATEHAPYAIRCMKKGMHVLSEVLPCETMAQAVELIEAVEETGMVYAYAENYCYMKHAFEMWQRYQSGALGEIQYAEGEYIHDCSAIWPSITYGERNHWRNLMHPNYYCTHSLGPIMTMAGLRPVKVVGFETNPNDDWLNLGNYCGAGIEMVTLENGAVLKSVHGWLKHGTHNYRYRLFATKGMMEGNLSPLNLEVFTEGAERCKGEIENYQPETKIAAEASKTHNTHGGSDFYPTHFFIEKILGREDGKWSIDVYSAVNMGICGILAYRSVLAGNQPIEVPDLRDPAQRDAYRNDHACTNPAVAGDQLLPRSSYGEPDFPDEVFENVKRLWQEGKNA